MEEVKQKKEGVWQHGGIAIGVRVSNLKERKIKQCLTCKRPECNGCPKSEGRWKKNERFNQQTGGDRRN